MNLTQLMCNNLECLKNKFHICTNVILVKPLHNNYRIIKYFNLRIFVYKLCCKNYVSPYVVWLSCLK